MHKLHLPIFLLSFVYFLGIKNLFAQDQSDLVSRSPQERPLAEPLPAVTRVLQSALLQRHMERKHKKKERHEEGLIDFSASKVTYIGREGLSPAGSEQLTSTDEDSIPFEYSAPSVSRPHVSFGESHTREYKPGSGTLLGKEETVKKVEGTCWDTFGTVVATADSAPPVLPPLPVDQKAPDRRETFIPPTPSMAETISMFGDPAEDFRVARGDIPYAPGTLPGVIAADEEKTAIGSISAPSTQSLATQLSFPQKNKPINKKDMQDERKMQEEHDDNYESRCCGCVVC